MNFKNNKAIYLQIADYICENILIEKWKSDERIASVREFAVDIEVNPNTVMRTYSFLQEKGIIYNKRGIGYFISDHAYKLTLQLKKEEFYNNDFPDFMKKIKLLKIDPKDLLGQNDLDTKRQS